MIIIKKEAKVISFRQLYIAHCSFTWKTGPSNQIFWFPKYTLYSHQELTCYN